MKLLSTLFILTATQFSTSVLATGTHTAAPQSFHIECETCVTESHFTQAARDNAIHRETVFINVMNIDNYKINKYSVYKNSKTVCDPSGKEPDSEGGFIQDCWLEETLTANKVNLTNTELNAFRSFADLQNDMTAISQFAIEVPAGVIDNGYELIGASFNETAINQYFNSLPVSQTLVESMGLYFDSATQVISTSYIKIKARPIVFNLADGSKVYAVLSFIDMDNVVHLSFIELHDTSDNVIMLNNKENPFSTEFKTVNVSQASWKILLESFKGHGLAVDVLSGTPVPQGTVTIIDCSNSTETVCRNPL